MVERFNKNMKNIILSLTALILLNNLPVLAQDIWIPFNQQIFVQPQPIVIQQPIVAYNYPAYQWVPVITYQPVFIQKRIFCDHFYWVNKPRITWIYQPIYR
jgi:hypothetical protein